jgi:glutamyl-tRNA reductase
MKFTASALVLYSLVATSSNAFTTIPSTTTSTTRTAPQQQKQHQQQKQQWLTTASTTARHVATEPQAETATTAKKTREVSVFLVHAGVFVIATLWYSSSSSSSIYIYINIYIYILTHYDKQERLEAASKGLQVHVVGLSIHHAQVEVREKLAIPEPSWNAASADLVATGAIAEAAILSTCNRFEVYYAATDAREAMAAVTQYLSKRGNLPVSTLRKNLFMLSGDDAVWHIMRVAGGLDSLVVGEGQILSQVRQCHLRSIEEEGSGGKVLSRLLQNAVSAGKRVRSETAISKGSVSISSAAVELSEMLSAPDLKLPFAEARLAVVGAGKMTRLLITHLASRGLERITIVNRSKGSAQELADQFPDVEIEIKLMEDLWDVIAKSDIVYTATSAVDYIVDKNRLEENGLAGGKPLMLVDIAVPRNVGTDCKEVSLVHIRNMQLSSN